MNRAERRFEMKGNKTNSKREGEKSMTMKEANVKEIMGKVKEEAMYPEAVSITKDGLVYKLDSIANVKRAAQSNNEGIYGISSVNFSTYIAYYYRSIWTRKRIEALEEVIFKNLYKRSLVMGYVADDRQAYVDEVGFWINELDFAIFDEVLADNEDLSELDSIRLNILRKSFEEIKKVLEVVGITDYECSLHCKSEKDEMRLLINHFLNALFIVPGFDSILEPQIFSDMRERTLVKAIQELSRDGLTIWQASPTAKDKKGKYSFFTAASNPKLLDAGEDVVVKQVM